MLSICVVSDNKNIHFYFQIAGNAVVVYIVLRNHDMRNATNVFLLNLSVADILVVLICMPSALAEFYGKDVWYLGPVMCKYRNECIGW